LPLQDTAKALKFGLSEILKSMLIRKEELGISSDYGTAWNCMCDGVNGYMVHHNGIPFKRAALKFE